MHLEDLRETVQRREFNKKSEKESFTKNQALRERKNLKQQENANLIINS